MADACRARGRAAAWLYQRGRGGEGQLRSGCGTPPRPPAHRAERSGTGRAAAPGPCAPASRRRCSPPRGTRRRPRPAAARPTAAAGARCRCPARGPSAKERSLSRGAGPAPLLPPLPLAPTLAARRAVRPRAWAAVAAAGRPPPAPTSPPRTPPPAGSGRHTVAAPCGAGTGVGARRGARRARCTYADLGRGLVRHLRNRNKRSEPVPAARGAALPPTPLLGRVDPRPWHGGRRRPARPGGTHCTLGGTAQRPRAAPGTALRNAPPTAAPTRSPDPLLAPQSLPSAVRLSPLSAVKLERCHSSRRCTISSARTPPSFLVKATRGFSTRLNPSDLSPCLTTELHFPHPAGTAVAQRL